LPLVFCFDTIILAIPNSQIHINPKEKIMKEALIQQIMNGVKKSKACPAKCSFVRAKN
jgi:hypothetical protein